MHDPPEPLAKPHEERAVKTERGTPPRLMLEMASLPATAHRRTTISISSRRCQNAGWCEHIHQRSKNDWGTFRLVWFCEGIVTSNT